MERGPILVVAACIVRGDSVLLACRNQPTIAEAHLKWELPGGKVQFGETPQVAIRREIEEELGTTINVVRLLPHLQTNVYRRSDGTIGHFVVVAFESVILKGSGKPVAADPSVKRFKWATRAELPEMQILPGTIEFVRCLDRIDQASFDDAQMYVRLERHDEDHQALRDYWEFQLVRDLFGEFSLLERHVLPAGRSTKTKVMRSIPESGLWNQVTVRVRQLAREGYVVSKSTTPLLQPPSDSS